MLPGRKSGFRAGFRLDSVQETLNEAFPLGIWPKSGPENRFPDREHYCVTSRVGVADVWTAIKIYLYSLGALKPVGKMIMLVLVFCCFGFVLAKVGRRTPLNGPSSKKDAELA